MGESGRVQGNSCTRIASHTVSPRTCVDGPSKLSEREPRYIFQNTEVIVSHKLIIDDMQALDEMKKVVEPPETTKLFNRTKIIVRQLHLPVENFQLVNPTRCEVNYFGK